MDMALSDIKVLDLTQGIAGPYCTKMLGDYGADVIKVERPDGGDFTRRLGPFPDHIPHLEKSGLFLMLNINKRGVTLNLKSAAGRKILLDLVQQADVVVESFAPRVFPSLGLSYETLAAVNSEVILVSISNFGQTGPYRDYKASEMTLYGMGGALHTKGLPGREPMKYGTNVSLHQAGLVGALATMTALFGRESRGDGEHVDISIFETSAHSRDARSPDVISAQFVNQMRQRRMPGSAMGSGTFPCKDGYIVFGAGGARFPQAIAMLGRPELLDDPRFATRSAQLEPENVVAFNQGILLPWFMQHTMREAWAKAQEHHIISGPIYSAADLLADDHFRDRGMWVEIDHPVAGSFTYPGRPIIMGETPWQMRRPAPQLGEHNEEIYCQTLGYSREELARLPGQSVI
jgi:crotonobetainyl-CoA:carnitine CoA-transferase CaiB-like acyl-CoA transferase